MFERLKGSGIRFDRCLVDREIDKIESTFGGDQDRKSRGINR